MNSYSPENFP